MFNLWLLFGSMGSLLIILYFKYISFKKIEDEKTVRHIFNITPPSFIEVIVVAVIFILIIKFSYLG
jgi:hypothetical protein